MGISDRFARRMGSAPRTGARGIGGVRGRTKLLIGGGIAVAAAGALAATALGGAGSVIALTNAAAAGPAAVPAAAAAGGYQFVTIGSHKDRTFNQILGINNNGSIAAYFGSGAVSHPNKGYEIFAPYAQNDIKSENFPGAVQTQAIGLNDHGVQVGFYSTEDLASGANNNFGWYFNGSFHKVVFPTNNNAKPTVDQLLGVNDSGIAVGFYNDSAGNAHGYTYNIKSHHFALVTKPGGGATSLTPTAINAQGDIAGFYTAASGTVEGFLKLPNGHFITLAVRGASATNAFGVNDNGAGTVVVGTYTDGTGSTATTHGFVWRGGHLTVKVDDPKGIGATTLNGINNEGDIVGFYTDSAGNTDGLVAFPAF